MNIHVRWLDKGLGDVFDYEDLFVLPLIVKRISHNLVLLQSVLAGLPKLPRTAEMMAVSHLLLHLHTFWERNEGNCRARC